MTGLAIRRWAALLCAALFGSGCGASAGPASTPGSAGGGAGASGAAGTVATAGAAGSSAGGGTTGSAGSTGGTSGSPGAAAAAGTTGAAGTTASAGTNGAAGTSASAGTSGAAGTTGSAGTTGAAGAGGAGGAPAATTAAGTIVPLYTDPGDASWTAIVSTQLAHPTVHVVAIVNPNSGPGAARSGAFTTGIAKLVAAKIVVIGYVATGYASHSLASMEAAIDQWKAFYPQLEGIFFDEQSDKATDVEYYRTLSQHAKAQGLGYTVGNPGADTAEAFVGALDTMLIYESKGLPSLSSLGGWHTKYPPASFGVIPYGTAFDASFVAAARKDVGYIYLQSDDLPNPWDTLPASFGDLLGALE